jgi:glycosyltransferase involved in cell wall biosynthesis
MSRPIRVLELCSSLTTGGGERQVHGIVQHLDRNRFEPHVCAISVVRGNAFLPEFEQLGVPVTVIGAKNLRSPMAYRALAGYVRREGIDLIHTHLTSADIVGRLVGRWLSVPVVSTLHNVPEDYEKQQRYRYWLERYTSGLADHLAFCSEQLRQMFLRRWRLPAHKTSTILNGVAMDVYLAVPAGVPPRPAGLGPLITTIGRLHEQKAQEVLIEAAKFVLAAHPTARFMIVGHGPREEQLKALARQLGLADKIDFAGVRYDIPEVLGQSDIFALSSAWEGLPVVGVEAMAAARPVVMTDVGGVRDLVDHERTGLIVPPGDPAVLAQALIRLLDDDERRREMGQAARARVSRDFSIATTAARYEALFEQILSRRIAGRSRASVGGL